MIKYLLVFFLGGVSAVVFSVASPLPLSNLSGFLVGGGLARIEAICDADEVQCAYVRTENGIGVNAVPVTTVFATARAARHSGFVPRRIECDPGALVSFTWTPEGLKVLSTDGACEERGTGEFKYPVNILNK